jgi:glycerol-3-phosphate acyltransferase PlsX
MTVRIAIDAMGGDTPPDPAVEASRILVESEDAVVALVGDSELLGKRITESEKIQIVHANSAVGMHEPASVALKKKSDSSIAVAVQLVKEGKADAVISPGNTGATMACAMMGLGRLPGVKRPAIATILPTGDHPVIVLDVGANVDCKPEMFVEFAVMGSVYAEEVLGRLNPRVGLLSNGTEDSKGNEQTKAAFKLLSEAPIHFVGNMEGRQVFGGEYDVVTCDGFVGNVLLKFGEATTRHIYAELKDQIKEVAQSSSETAGVLRDFFENMFRKMDHEEYGGAPLLGVNGTCLICHGGATARAIANASRTAISSLKQNVNDWIVERLSVIHALA